MFTIVIIALVSSIVAGAFYYAKQSGIKQCQAEHAQKAKDDTQKEVNRWINAPRDGVELSQRLYARAKYKHSARLQRTARYMRGEVVGGSNVSAAGLRDKKLD